jgi:IclR family pca regulon transcriptional regulator
MSSRNARIGTDRRIRARPEGASAGREFVQGLQRGFAVIRAFGADSPNLTITDVAQSTGLTRAVARRYILTLMELGYIVQDGSWFALTPRILDLGFTYLSGVDVTKVGQPVMEQIAATLEESCSAAVLDGQDIVYVARVPAKRIMSVNLIVGSRLPAHATSMGKVLLAHLSRENLDAYLAAKPLRPLTKNTLTDEAAFRKMLKDVRERGWAFSNEESELGVRTVAAPLYNHSNHVEAAINVAAHASRVSMKQLKEQHLPVLLAGARQISRALGAKQVPVNQARQAAAGTGRPTARAVFEPLRGR